MSVPAARPPLHALRTRTASGALCLTLAAGGAAAALLGGAAPAGAATSLAPGCRAPAPKAAGAGTARAAVKRLVRRAGTDLTRAPRLRSPSSRAPTRLVRDDVVRCGGTAARTGDRVQVRYALVAWGGRSRVLDSTWRAGTTPASFVLDESQLVKGFVRGVRGMTPGSRRIIVVPPRLGYGAQGTPDGGVRRNATLIFAVDLVKIG